ncbi:gypsy type transposase, partial [Tanacetum coccineum]
EFENEDFIPNNLHDNKEDVLYIDDGKKKKKNKNRSTKNVVLDDDDCELIKENNLAFRRPTSESCKRLKKARPDVGARPLVETEKSQDWLLASIRNQIVDAARESAHTLCVGVINIIFKVHRCILRVMGMERDVIVVGASIESKWVLQLGRCTSVIGLSFHSSLVDIRERLSIPEAQLLQAISDKMDVQEEGENLNTGALGTGRTPSGGTSAPVGQAQGGLSPVFMKENIDVLRTMIKELDNQGQEKVKQSLLKLPQLSNNSAIFAHTAAQALKFLDSRYHSCAEQEIPDLPKRNELRQTKTPRNLHLLLLLLGPQEASTNRDGADEFLSQYNVNLARQVAIGSQLRLRFEQEAKLLKKFVAQVTRRDQRIATREKHIKDLEVQLEAGINMKKAAESKNSEVTKELEDLRMRFSGLEVVNARAAEMDCTVWTALSDDFDDELYPHMIEQAIAVLGVIGDNASGQDAIAANISRAEKKKKSRVICHTHGVGSAHHARSDGIPVLVPTVAP